MRRVVLVLMTLTFGAGAAPAMGASPEPLIGSDPADGRAVAAVRGTDPRFAALEDYANISQRAASTFDITPIVAGSWIHVLPTYDQFIGQYGTVMDPDGSGLGRVVEVMLVADCLTHITTVEAVDPCAWRHTWLYRVLPDGSVTQLLDAGSPDASPG